ncbi:sufE-like protein 1, chloroplastic/mitochondrial [Henckelia pumila]|uniref:sufE-like protein 1, chloroplastic/mitochondrial n=1 Tax=Henckelia pumila TaxID=405737 RepID=UPI003C6E1583
MITKKFVTSSYNHSTRKLSAISFGTSNRNLMSISSRIPYFPLFHQSNTQISNSVKVPSLSSSSPQKFFFNPITIQKIPTKKANFSAPPSSSSVSLQPIEELPPKLQEIVNLFRGVQEPKAKYEQLLFYGRNLKPLESQYKTSDNKVQGCVSHVWVRAYLDDDKNIIFEADSDSVLTKGLAALLVQGLSGRPVDEILRVSPDFVVLLGLQQSLTPSRNNGFLNMLKLMQKKALQLYVVDEKLGNSTVDEFGEGPVENSNLESNDSGGDDGSTTGETFTGIDKNSENGSLLGSRGVRIKEMLEKELRPLELEVEDISYQHAGHSGFRGSDAETHFNVKVVSEEFEGKSLVKRHRLIYSLLQDELQGGLHALSIVAKTPAEVGTQ